MVHAKRLVLIRAGIFGGALLGVRASNRLSLYNWDSLELVRRIEIQTKQVGTGSGQPQEVAVWDDSASFVVRYTGRRMVTWLP